MKWFFIITVISIIGCDERLPVRHNPEEYFSTSMWTEYDVFYPDNAAQSRNRLLVMLRIVNAFDDVIQDYVEVSGTVELEWLMSEEASKVFKINPKRTMKLSMDNILRADGLDRETMKMTFAPRETVILMCAWNFKTNDSTSFFKVVPTKNEQRCFVRYPGGLENYRKITQPEEFVVSGSVRLTKRTSTFYFDKHYFKRCFVYPYLHPIIQPDGSKCITEQGIDPCNLIE